MSPPARRRLLAAAALLLAGRAAADDLALRLDLTAARDETSLATEQYLRQVYEAIWRRRVSVPLGYGLRLRYQEDRGETRAPGFTSRVLTRVAAPSADLSWTIPEARVLAGWDLAWSSDLDPAGGGFRSRSLERVQLGASLIPTERFVLSAGGDSSSAEDPAAGLSSRDTRASASMEFRGAEVQARLEERWWRFEDTRGGSSRTSTGPVASASLLRRLGEGGQLQASYALDYMESRSEATATTARIPVLQAPVAGLYAVTDLPLDTSTAPMASTPALVDRNLTAPAGVPLGPDGVSFQNVGLDLGRSVIIDELQLHVRGPGGTPVPFGGPILFTAYESLDGVRWTEIAGAEPAVFVAPLSAWRVAFPAHPVRFVKLVNLGVSTVQTDVTELQAYAHEAPTRSARVLQAVGLSAGWRPVERLQLTYAGQGAFTSYMQEGQPQRDGRDLVNTVTAVVGPFGPLSVQASQSQSSTDQDGSPSQATLGTSLGLRWQPLRTLSATVEGRRSAQRVGALRTETWGQAASLSAEPWDTLRGAATFAISRQDVSGGGSSDYLTWSGLVQARPRPEVDVTLTASVQRTWATRGDVSAVTGTPQLRVAQYQRYLAEAAWHPSPLATLSGRLGWVGTPTRSGTLQALRLAWSPLPDGAVQLAFDYNEDVDPLSGQHFRRAGATPRWNVNRHAYLELTYNYVRAMGQSAMTAQSLYLTLSVTL